MIKKIVLWVVIPMIIIVPLDVMSGRVESRQLSFVLSFTPTVLAGLWWILLIKRSNNSSKGDR